jgi:hypothetical protein
MRNLFDKELTAMQQTEFIELLRISNQQKTFDRLQLFDALLRLDLDNIHFAITDAINRE